MTVALQYLTDLEMNLKLTNAKTESLSVLIQNLRKRYNSRDQKLGVDLKLRENFVARSRNHVLQTRHENIKNK